MDAKLFAWYYVLTNCVPGTSPSYYGGVQYDDDVMELFGFTYQDMYKTDFAEKFRDSVFKHIKEVGVDWNKTNEPQSDQVNQFEGTFAESSVKETLNGTLVLKDGTAIDCVSTSIDTSKIFELMALAHGAKQKLEKIVGPIEI